MEILLVSTVCHCDTHSDEGVNSPVMLQESHVSRRWQCSEWHLVVVLQGRIQPSIGFRNKDGAFPAAVLQLHYRKYLSVAGSIASGSWLR